MGPREVEKVVCTARKPGARFYKRLADELQALDASKKARKLEPWNPSLIADLNTTVERLACALEADWRENMRENLPCDFEYQVIRAATPVDHIRVLTRLFKKGHPQSIFYGRSIAKLENGKFALWI